MDFLRNNESAYKPTASSAIQTKGMIEQMGQKLTAADDAILVVVRPHWHQRCQTKSRHLHDWH